MALVVPGHNHAYLEAFFSIMSILTLERLSNAHAVVSNSSQSDPSINLGYGNSFCLQQTFAELCNDAPAINDEWMLRVSPSATCNVTYTAISNGSAPESQQTISIANCRAIYVCWLVFESRSVCLYDHTTPGIPSEPSEQLYLALITVQDGNWILLSYPISVFTPGQYPDTISSSVALFETIDDESESEAAVFLIGKGQYVHRVKLLFQPSPVERRLTKACDQHHRVIHISATKHDVLVVCDNKVHRMVIGKWKSVDVTPPELTGVIFTGRSVNCYILNNSTGLITRNTAGNTEYCFIGQPSQDMLSQCGVIPNVSLNHGLLIIRNKDTQFLALFDGDIVVVSTSSNDSYETISVDFCHAQDNCRLVLTKYRIYIGNEQKTMVLDRETLRVITVYNVSVYEMLGNQLVLSPTLTTASTSTIASNSSTITQTTTSPVNTSSTSALKPIITSTNTTGNVSSNFTRLTTMSIIDVPTSTSAVKSTSETRFKPSETSMAESPTAVDDANSNSTANNPESDTKSEFGALNIIIGISIVLSIIILILLLIIAIIILAAKCHKMKLLRRVKIDRQEKIEFEIDHQQSQKLSEMDTVQSESDNGKSGGEVVMIPPDTDMYELDASTTITSTVTQATSNNMTKQKVLFK